ncbi:MAG: hypothetical protein LBQ24_06690 [Candidatus Peribacteria bacterium]|nr:hypothetical protein [Candidatus Peribacteria bacterium]
MIITDISLFIKISNVQTSKVISSHFEITKVLIEDESLSFFGFQSPSLSVFKSKSI